MSEERIAIVCMSTDGYAPRVAGSTRAYCSVCAAEVWVAPSSREVADAARDPMFLCVDCAPGVMATEANPIVEPISAAQRAELRALGWDT